MEKIKEFSWQGAEMAVEFVESQVVKEGVICDIYKFVDNETMDLALVAIEPGQTTPLQRILKGEHTVEGYVSGAGVIEIDRGNGHTERYSFPESESVKSEVEVFVGDIMQWQANDETGMVFSEVCIPPYADGRFEDL